MYVVFHMIGSVGRLYLKRKNERRSFIIVIDYVKPIRKEVLTYVKESEERILKVVTKNLDL